MVYEHPLLNQDKKFKGYTVFKLSFNGVDIEFMTLKDVQKILEVLKKGK